VILLPELATPATATVAVVLVQQPVENDKPGEEEFGKSSPLGLVVLLLFLVAVVLLVRSMTKHLKRVPESFEQNDDTEPAADEQATGAEPEPGAGDSPENHESDQRSP